MILDIQCDEIDASVNRNGRIDISLRGCDSKLVLDQFDIDDVIQHFGESDLLDKIGSDECQTHFDLIEDSQ